MKEIELFLERLPLDKDDFPKVPATIKKKYTQSLPGFIIELWETYGFCSFGNGFIWMINPDDLAPILPKIEPRFKDAIAVLRTGMGIIFFKLKNEYFYFDPAYVRVFPLEDNPLENIMNYSISKKSSAAELYFKTLYDKALKRLGKPGYDECFAFVPAIPMGGDLDADTLQKVKLKEHLLFLLQLK